MSKERGKNRGRGGGGRKYRNKEFGRKVLYNRPDERDGAGAGISAFRSHISRGRRPLFPPWRKANKMRGSGMLWPLHSETERELGGDHV